MFTFYNVSFLLYCEEIHLTNPDQKQPAGSTLTEN